MAYPTDETLMELVDKNFLNNCTVSSADVRDVNIFIEHNWKWLKWGKFREKPQQSKPRYVSISNDFHGLHKFVDLMKDVMFVYGYTTMLTLSRDI